MRKITLFLAGLLLALTAQAVVNIKDGERYRFACMNYDGAGYMVLGANHGAAAYVYYSLSLATPSDDSWWVVSQDGSGYTISNAQSGEFLVYKEGRLTNAAGEYVAKGIQLATAVTDDTGRWQFSENNQGALVITNVAQPSQSFNVRVDGTYLVGTYESAASANSFFMLYDADGNPVVSDTGEGDGDGSVSGNSGVTDAGLYWERTGLAQPVVYTTDIANPVLYNIQNVRSGMYVTASGTQLVQTAAPSEGFYFVEQADGGLKIFTNGGQYAVSTSFTTSDEGRNPLSLVWGSTSGNIWKLDYSDVTGYAGYTVCKADNLPLGNGGWNMSGQSGRLYWNDYDVTGGRYVGLYDVDAGSTFLFLSSDNRHLQHLLDNGLSFEGVTPTGFKAYVDSVRIDGKDLIYDVRAKAYYYPLPTDVRGGNDFTASLEVKMKAGYENCKLRIGGNVVDASGNISIPAVTCDAPYTISVVKDGTEEVAAAQLNFTFLPIVEVSVPTCNSSTYTTGTIRVTDPGMAGYDSIFIAAFRYRGASALSYSKKSYAVKLRDATGASVDREFFGLRDDNNWILDAMSVDRSCMRNRVSTDLWNDFAIAPYHRREGWEKKARTGTRGRFVEVFLNGQYHGLYCMTEKMDRKQLKLKKSDVDAATGDETVRGTLYKSSNWSYEVFMGHYLDQKTFPRVSPQSYNNDKRAETWASYEIKYPDWEEEKIDWKPLWNAINFVAVADDPDFNTEVSSWFDMPVVNDYYLFIELMLATDNHGKNMFFFNYDQLGEKDTKKIGIAPWDLDGTWGRRWDGSRDYTAADQDFDTYLWTYEHGTHTLFYRMLNSTYWNWENALKERYAELRSNYFSTESLVGRFRDYESLFTESHAAQREKERWPGYHYDIEADVDYIAEWIADRIDYLDRQYDYTPVIDGVQAIGDGSPLLGVSGGDGFIRIHAAQPTAVRVYTVDGILMRTFDVQQPVTLVEDLAAGVYLVNGQKVLVH